MDSTAVVGNHLNYKKIMWGNLIINAAIKGSISFTKIINMVTILPKDFKLSKPVSNKDFPNIFLF